MGDQFLMSIAKRHRNWSTKSPPMFSTALEQYFSLSKSQSFRLISLPVSHFRPNVSFISSGGTAKPSILFDQI